MFWCRAFHICVYAYYVYIFRRALFENKISELGIGIKTSIFGMALNAFWKRALHILRSNTQQRGCQCYHMNGIIFFLQNLHVRYGVKLRSVLSKWNTQEDQP